LRPLRADTSLPQASAMPEIPCALSSTRQIVARTPGGESHSKMFGDDFQNLIELRLNLSDALELDGERGLHLQKRFVVGIQSEEQWPETRCRSQLCL
jgi:hypothetical protein